LIEMRVMEIGVLGVLAALLATPAAGQRQTGPEQGRGRGAAPPEFAGPPQGPNDVPIVQVVGCLTEGPTNTWIVTDATEPVKAPPGFSKAEELKAAEGAALGARRFRLIGLVEMSPAEHKGHKVVVKGLLLDEGNESRLNVTSLMTASARCGA
jgi:hypothetical protein